MELTRSVVRETAADYRQDEPLYAVEAEAIEVFPEMFAAGRFGWRDAEWVVRWYYRRFLGAYPDADRRAIEARFDDNEYDAVAEAIEAVASAADPEANVERLTDLAGVDVPVATAFLTFIDPDSYIVVGEREWSVLQEAGVLSDPYPDPPSPAAYATYLDHCTTLADRVDCDLWILYMALWRLGKS